MPHCLAFDLVFTSRIEKNDGIGFASKWRKEKWTCTSIFIFQQIVKKCNLFAFYFCSCRTIAICVLLIVSTCNCMQSQWLLWWRRRPLLWRKQTSEITIEFHFCGNDASHDIHSQWAFNWYWLHFFRPVIPPSQWLQLARVMNKLGNHHNEF